MAVMSPHKSLTTRVGTGTNWTRRLVRAARVRKERLFGRWWLWRFLALDSRTHEEIRVGAHPRFYVPVRANGEGRITIGDNNVFGFPLSHRLGNGEILLQARTPEAEIVLGSDNMINNNCAIYCTQQVLIGNSCLLGEQVGIYDSDFHNVSPVRRREREVPSAPIKVGNNVWIGSRAMILKGVTIGDNTVIGAMSLVTRSLPANCVAAGVPARILREIT